MSEDGGKINRTTIHGSGDFELVLCPLYPEREQSKMRTGKEKSNKTVFEVIENEVSTDIEPRRLPIMKPIKEMVELTGLSYTYLRNLCIRNEIVHIRTGKKYLINYDRFIDYLNGVVHS